MQALILAGGLGTRIQSIAGDRPKALLPVGDSTFLSFQLRWLKILGVDRVVLAIGHKSAAIEDHVKVECSGSIFPEVIFSIEGDSLLGTAGAIRLASPLLDPDFVVTYGDTFLRLNVKALYTKHIAKKSVATLAVLKNENRGDRSNVIFKGDRVVVYDKAHPTPEMSYIDYGMSVLNKNYFLANTPAGKSDLSVFQHETSLKNQMAGFEVKHPFWEIGTPEGYKGFLNALAAENFDLIALHQKIGI